MTIKDAQSKLNALGFNAGSVDGVNGPQTKAAVLAFQKAYNVYPQDGILGPITYNAISKAYSEKVIDGKASPSPSSDNSLFTFDQGPLAMAMSNKKVVIGAGVLAAMAVAFYVYKKRSA